MPESAQKPPRSAQERPKRRPRVVQEDPKPLQNRGQGRPRQDFGMFVVRSAFRKAPGAIFRRFSFMRNTCDVLKTYEKPRKKCSFSDSGIFAHSSLARMQKPRKIGPGGLRNPPKTLQNRPRSAPERKKIDQERQQTQQEAQNAAKKRPRAGKDGPRAKNGANMAQYGFGGLEDL